MKLEKKELVFLAKFFAIFAVSEWLIVSFGFLPLQEFIAQTQAGMLGLESFGTLIFAQGGAFEITASCTGLVSASVLAAIIFSLKKPALPQKAIVFLAGFAVLLALNYLRVLVVVLIGVHFGLFAAEIAHVISWFATTVFIIAVWYWFSKKITGEKDFSGFL